MATNSAPSRAVVLCGTEQPDTPGRVLKAGPLSVEFDNGQLRYLKVHGVEVLRVIGFLVRDENWGTYIPTISNLKVSEGKSGFSISFHAVCRRGDMEISYDATIEGKPEGLEFHGTATPKTDFLTARTGFVVLHPLKGVAGNAVEVEHTDGKIEKSTFPEQVNPIQPFLLIRSLTHEVLPGLKATVRMEGDAWEMEDHRNWTDASFKTYVRPLALPWPYTLKAGEVVKQSIKVSLSGKATAKSAKTSAGKGIEVKLGAVQKESMPPIGLGVPAEEIAYAVKNIGLLKHVAPRILICHYDPREKHGLKEMYGYRVLCDQTGADAVLEIVVQSLDKFRDELMGVAKLVKESGLKVSAIAVCPVGDLKAVLPGGPRPPAPPLPELYAAARSAFPGIRLGGGMFSFFTELNRKHPPAQLLDFVTNTTCPIVHAADDRSVMETLEALPYQMLTARTFIGKTPHRVGPSAIGCRDNPHGKTFTPNPNNERICLVKMDPRQRGLFGAAWTLGYIATLARAGAETISMGAPTGPLGIIYRKTDYAQPYYDSAKKGSVYPAFHVVTGLTRAAACKMVSAVSSDNAKVECIAYRAKGATILWLANLTSEKQTVAVSGTKGKMFAGIIDESSFVAATTDPKAFETQWRALAAPTVTLGAYGVAFVAIND